MAVSLTISVSSDLHPAINGMPIVEAFTVKDLHDIMGGTARIQEPGTPAPHGHRNNQLHVYDDYGVYFIEHHYTRRIDCCGLIFWREQAVQLPHPKREFNGILDIAGYQPFGRVTERDFLKGCHHALKKTVGPWQSARSNGFSLDTWAIGERLKSGRRSKRRYITNVFVSWPADPWRQPDLNA